MLKTVEMDFEYMEYINDIPVTSEQQFQMACSNDSITVKSWRNQWVEQAQANKKTYKSFKENGIQKLFNQFKNKPCIVMGAGPDLKENIKEHAKAKQAEIPLISVLHNFHYCIDNGVSPDYFVSLDAGKVTLEEIFEGGQKKDKDGEIDKEFYLNETRKFTLLAYIGSHPDLLKAWRGRIIFFNAPIPDPQVRAEIEAVEPFHAYVSSGGNVLGASTYIAKAILGCNPIAWTGASFSFSYDKKFHPWDSKYDKELGKCLRAIDVFGNKRLTWQSYYNFCNWFTWVTRNIAGIYYNCTEGGILGSYPEGNLRTINQMTLERFIYMYSMNESIADQFKDVTVNTRKLLF
jgi:hypothetical protein